MRIHTYLFVDRSVINPLCCLSRGSDVNNSVKFLSDVLAPSTRLASLSERFYSDFIVGIHVYFSGSYYIVT